MNIEEVMYNEREKAFSKNRSKIKSRTIFIAILIISSLGFYGFYYALKRNATSQWDSESKLYIQGYLDGKLEVLDSIKNQ
tara:strand:- start:1862 stop:2101 length:240 start_codon:yes stop_codon:yes gene_type:complete